MPVIKMKQRVAQPLAKMVVETWKPVIRATRYGCREHDNGPAGGRRATISLCLDFSLVDSRILLYSLSLRALLYLFGIKAFGLMTIWWYYSGEVGNKS
jgi:hypothetical protein